MRCLILSALIVFWPLTVCAQQVMETAGSRALGMAGAFVAVADDATAVYWNPAGLAKGPWAGMTIGWVDFRIGNQKGPPQPGLSRRSSKAVSLGTVPLGLSYLRTREVDMVASATGALEVRGLETSQFGATILQTVAEGVTVGSTVRYIRGRPISGLIDGLSADDAFEQAGDSTDGGSGALDLDVGVIAEGGPLRLGLAVRNLREPSFGKLANSAIRLQRHARIGLAVQPTDGVTLAIDADLDTVDLRDGPRRMLALGGEDRFGRRWALRGGVRWNLERSKRAVAAVGVSVALRRTLWLDGHYTAGGIDADRGFGIALRAGY